MRKPLVEQADHTGLEWGVKLVNRTACSDMTGATLAAGYDPCAGKFMRRLTASCAGGGRGSDLRTSFPVRPSVCRRSLYPPNQVRNGLSKILWLGTPEFLATSIAPPDRHSSHAVCSRGAHVETAIANHHGSSWVVGRDVQRRTDQPRLVAGAVAGDRAVHLAKEPSDSEVGQDESGRAHRFRGHDL